jgi:acyl transferase domain-containing protein/acyl carrier protein
MDDAQKWAIACTREALVDYGYPKRPLNTDRTAVILGNAMAGEKHYLTAMRLNFPDYAHELAESESFAKLPEAARRDITSEFHQRINERVPEVTEDTMPGELANCIAGRIANIYNFHGPNYVVDAACASAMAAISAAVEGLVENDFDVAVTGGIDRNMGATSYIKFSKIGALSASGTRPYAAGADGFVMGEGAAIFLLKRLADAERDGDKIYAVLRGIGGSSDGKGKGITAPNPVGQKICIRRAWENAGLSPATAGLIEGHGTSTSVGDAVEVESFTDVLSSFHVPIGTVALGSVKSNIGHLKGAAGAAGILKTALALRDKVLPPSVHCEQASPNIDFAHSPLYVNGKLRPWTVAPDGVRRAGVSAFGFGGTNFHAVLEEYTPHRLNGNGKKHVGQALSLQTGAPPVHQPEHSQSLQPKPPLRGALLVGAASAAALAERLQVVQKDAASGRAPAPAAPSEADLRAPERIAIDYADAAELADKSAKALKALAANQPMQWKALRAQGVFRGHGPAPKVAFLYTGQGSQYANMLSALRAAEPIVAETFAEADRVMTPLLGKPLTDYLFVNPADAGAVAKAEEDLRQTEITQPAVMAIDLALTRLLAAYGIRPDMAMGHSLGEYGALVAAGAMPFTDALEAVSARGRGMTQVSMGDNGRMAAVFAPLEEIERVLKAVNGYVVIANINSNTQAVIGGASQAVEQAMEILQKAGHNAVPLPVSHAFHTSIVAPASAPLRRVLERLHLEAPHIPVVANVNGEFYPTGPQAVPQMVDILARQVASPVQFIQGLRTLYDAGARVFVEVGPKKALQGFAEDVLGDRPDVLAVFTNHPKFGDIPAFNQALCGLYAAGLGAGQPSLPVHQMLQPPAVEDRPVVSSHDVPVAITGAALGLPGNGHIFDDGNIARILGGEQLIDVIPTRFRRAMLDKHITRLVKSDKGGPTFESIDSVSDVIKLAGRGGDFDLAKEFGVSADRLAALDRATQLAIAVGLDALRDAGIPLVMRYKTTSRGTQLPERWGLPDALRDDTGVIFASVFPGFDSFAAEMQRYYADRARRDQLTMLESMYARLVEAEGSSGVGQEMVRRIDDLRAALEREPYVFDRRFLFHVLSMGHSQFAEFIGARGPNTQINSACASTTQAVSLANDWIRAGRCRRVVVVSADDITTDHLIDWFGAGFLASGAAATDDVVEEAATPFDRRRHGMIMGMGAAAIVVESAEAARERGIRPICEVLSAVTANSAFHGTRLDVEHICQVMENLVAQAEARNGFRRREAAPHMVFVSHETYTPARGGSAAAEIHALRRVFGDTADRIVIANTKGFTGHAMGTGIEDVVAVKALETGCVPPVANFKEVDPELGALNLSKGGGYPVEYALRLGAGFGSQISMTLLHWVAPKGGVRTSPHALGYASRIADPAAWSAWLTRIAASGAEGLEVVQRTLRIKDGASRAAQVRPAIETKVAKAAPEVEVKDVKFEPAASTPPPPASPAGDPVKERLLALVAEKTGYPSDMLDVDLDLEADLGVDTVKQADLLASVREAYGIVRDDKIKLRDFPTLAHVIRFVYEKRPDLKGQHPAPAAQQPVPAAPPALSPAPSPQAPASQAADPVRERLLALVAEKTGYPSDMLDPDLDLEADLGVDTVKQADLFASVREIYNIPRDNRKLRDFPTLAHVIRFVYENRPDLNGQHSAPVTQLAAPAAPPAPRPQAPASQADDPVRERLLALVAEKTGYPSDMLDPDLDLEADLGVDTVKQADLFASVREIYNIPRDQNRKLRDFPTLAHVIQFVYDNRPDLNVQQPAPVTEQPAPTAAPASIPQPPASQAADPVKERLLALVAEKTGYPIDMLDPGLDLEADLGVDTVKQADLFASVREIYNIPRDQNRKLRDFPTLAHVIQFVYENRPDLVGQAVSPAAPPAIAPDAPRADFAAVDAIPRRVPAPTLRPPLAICKPTAVTLEPGRRIAIMPDKGDVAEALAERLRATGVEVVLLDGTPVAAPVHGVYWLPALDHEGSLREMDLAAWREALRVRVKSLFSTMRGFYEQISTPDTFLVSATRLGGQHGYDDAGAVAPMGGAVTGFTKTYKRERPEALVKAVDFETECGAAEVAEALVAETLRDPGAVEIGYSGGLRWTVSLLEQPAADGQPGLDLNKDTVFLVTGAAGSIVSAITARLAAASGGTFHLLDLVPEPDPDNPDLRRLTTDKEALMRDLHARIKARGERATPALVEKELAALERAQAVCTAIDAVRAAGGAAHYYSVNLTDADAVSRVVGEIRERSGRIDVLLHAAGMERSRFLPDKDPREFDLVFDVKADGWFNLMHAIGDMPLRATVAFSSIAGRFGNAGQSDYSSANDLLCKIASSFRTTRPATRGIAIDWTAWGGIGMATRGSIPEMMARAGIDMLPPEAGIPWIHRELTAGGTRGEVVVARGLGVLMAEWDSTGGIGAIADTAAQPAPGPMLGRIAGISLQGELTVETALDPAVQPFLNDHRIEGKPVLPGVMGIEAFAETALCMLPGWHVEAIEEVNFLAPFKFYRSEPRTVTIAAVFRPHGQAIVADCRLTGSRSLPNQAEPQVTTHFTARVRLTKQPPETVTAPALGELAGSLVEAAGIYQVFFHGPAYRVLERAWLDEQRTVGQFSSTLPNHHDPPGLPLTMAPRLVELCFQTAALQEAAGQGRIGLPLHVDQVCLYRAPDLAEGPLYAVVTPDPRQDSFNAAVMDTAGNCYLQLRGYQMVVHPDAVDVEPLRGLQAVLA